MIKAAKKNVPEATFKTISMTDIDYKNEFDGVFSGYNMLCLDQKNFKKTAKNITKALKPTGYLFLSLNEPGQDKHKESENIIEILNKKSQRSRAPGYFLSLQVGECMPMQSIGVWNPLRAIKNSTAALTPNKKSKKHFQN